jgi:RHS repeat-associated protein
LPAARNAFFGDRSPGIRSRRCDIDPGSTWGYGYDGRKRLTVVQQNGATVATYVYNSSGLRVAKAPAATNSPVRFVYGPDGLLAGEYGSAAHEYIAIATLPLGVVDSASGMAAVHFIHADAIGAPRVVTDQSGAVLRTWAYASNPFGENEPVSGSAFSLNLRYPGQYRDPESSLTYNGARFYDSGTGRYIRSDPADLSAGPSTFSYVGSNALVL